ncbi:tRNA (N(6)-L-threonylcarbamoyladenosine(37)-C(2))-methylthiotransferase MtaB [Salipiger abyssi]|uniref:Threonylcarbamoyladenosine tRNA methylthiotransferase MtaB n=1 Tax=Salipiger abyssi TaxID=1250539 RepID=A0A1P8UVA6_9RHOB|nr:tRNA (N(6)-L-threonylcarbamoyladenosine(37)-C(2))-methylthiotransferase MtaB [Salipiger abyssi]APZ53319.1 threonylcarbamoyladenosine tRNA methylthiotransferase MtaB [Salipiger abyssi]
MSAPKFTTLGCRLNAYETEAMKALAEEAGVGDAVVINTCAVTAEAVRKARQEIRRLRRENPEARVIVTGCAAQIDPDSFAQMDEVDAVIGNSEKMAPDTWAGLSNGFIGETERVQVNDIMSVTETAEHLIDGFGTRSRAYVQVQNGCDHRCTFCIIPYGRGNSRSVPAGVVVDQIKRLVQQGYNEVVLTGVDLTSWGADLPGTPRLGDLVMRILKLTDVPRLRISSIDSIEADENLMMAIATESRLMPHLHLSLQHGDDLILKRMKRRHLRDDAIRFCEEARRLRPEMTFGADIIAGFPTETEAHFDNSLKLVEECDLTWLHVFPYSSRPGTPAAKIPNKVDGATIKARAARLRAAGEAAVARHLAAQQGKSHRILMEAPDMGRTEQFTEVTLTAPQTEGSIVTATITGQNGQRLVA